MKNNWPLFACTSALIATLIGCTWRIVVAIDGLPYDIYVMLRDLLRGT